MSASSLLRQSNGDLIVGGQGYYTTETSPINRQQHFFSWLARLTPSGRLDDSFGHSGVVFSEGPTNWHGSILEPRPRGLLVIGATGEANHEQITVWGLSNRGALDPSYGSGGELAVPDASDQIQEYPTAATVDHTHRLLIAASSGLRTRPDLVRITPNGRLDHSFGQEGITQGPPQSSFRALAVEPSGRILAAGALEPENPEPGNGGALEQRGLQGEDALFERFLATNPKSSPHRTRKP